MCTVSWLSSEDGYTLFFNRDEKRSRGIATPPAVHRRSGVEYIAPTDVDGGGTWIATNEHGVTICLLNSYHKLAERQIVSESRGTIPVELSGARSTGEAVSLLEAFSLKQFAPFRLLILQPGEQAWTYIGSGSALAIDSGAQSHMPLTSSSFHSRKVETARRAAFRRQYDAGRQLTAASLEAFHRSHVGGAGAYSVCMHRPDAQTVSYSCVTVSRASVDFSYTPGSPCSDVAAQTVRLDRAPALQPRIAAAS